MIDNPKEWVGIGVWHIQTAISVMNLLVDNKLVDLSLMDEMISQKTKTSGTQNEQALWETYRDFLNPDIDPLSHQARNAGTGSELPEPTDNVLRFPEGADFA
jgi:hypothetical protein|tara:strand:+ start:36 stop:341 length:306 start_codon:yes stop_codon:yes gene_type:complete